MIVLQFLLLGLVVGSFLNVVIYRVPIMFKREWERDLALASDQPAPEHPKFSLWTPRSHCPHCSTQLTLAQNIPILGFLLQSGKCRHCGAPISWRYPLVELLTGILFAFAAYQHPVVWTAAAVAFAVAFMIALTFIDLDEMLLPDSLTYLFMWSGFAVALSPYGLIRPDDAILGAIVGFGLLWLPAKAYALVTGRDGMGGGDLKYLAGIGAWVGLLPLVYGLVIASVLSLLVAVGVQLLKRKRDFRQAFPFGPFLSCGALFGLYF